MHKTLKCASEWDVSFFSYILVSSNIDSIFWGTHSQTKISLGVQIYKIIFLALSNIDQKKIATSMTGK